MLAEGDPLKHGIKEVHVWAYKTLLDALPKRPWLVPHNPPAIEQSLLKQVWWQWFHLQDELKAAGCAIALNTDAGTVSRFRPAVTMSRDMLSYEPGEMNRFGLSKARARLTLLRYLQNRSFRRSDGVVFLTRYAARIIQQSAGKLSRLAIIPHGVGPTFSKTNADQPWLVDGPIRCVYVSNVALYKHQWVVVQAIADLRRRGGHNLQLVLVGQGPGSGAIKAQRLLDKAIATYDSRPTFISQTGFIPNEKLASLLASAHLFIFASSCENMPNTLVEAMAVGLPIACSDRGPMPEVLKNGGVYFDPENAESIADAVEQIIKDSSLRISIARQAKVLSEQYSWARCAAETWEFLRTTAERDKR